MQGRLESLSEVEMCVLIVMIRPSSGGCPATLDEGYDLYKKQLELANEPVVPKKLFEVRVQCCCFFGVIPSFSFSFQRAFCSLSEVCEWRDFPLAVVEQVLDEDERYETNKWPTYMSKFLKGFA